MIPSDRFTALEDFVDENAPICYGILKPGKHVPEGVPVIKVKNIVGGKVQESELLKTSSSIHAQYKRSEVKTGDLLLTIRGSSGRLAVVPSSLAGANITQDTARIRVASEDDPNYVLYALQSPAVQRQIELNTIGQAVKGINIAEVRKIKIFHPELHEQKKIARILSVWDEAITTTERLVEASQQQRHALMQQLLPGKRRLPGFTVHPGERREKYGDVPNDWEFIEIGSFSRQSSEKNHETEELPVLSCSKYDGFVDSLSYFKKRVYSEDVSGYKVIRRGDIGFPSNHVEEGSIGLQNLYDRGLVSPIYVVFRPDEERVDPEFLFRLLKTDHYRQVFAASTNASVDRRGSLRWKEFSAIKVPLPSLDEQKAIVLALKTADSEIEAQQQRLDCLRQEKKALMQLLLTGKRRVKVRDEAA